MTKNAREMKNRRSKSKGAIFQRVGQTLDRPIKIRRCRVGKKEMLKPFRNEPPAANERIAQNERVIVPNKSIAHGRRVTCAYGKSDKQNGPAFFHVAKEVEQIVGIRV